MAKTLPSMTKRLKRAKRLLHLQNKLLFTERVELEAIRRSLEQAREEENTVIESMNRGAESGVPTRWLIRRAASTAVKIKTYENLLEQQTEKALNQARRKHLVQKRLDLENESFSRNEEKVALQATIDAYLNASLKQDK